MAFTECYNNNYHKFDWFLMVDMDEFLYIVNNSLKQYLANRIFNKCDTIIFHWVISTDNNLLYYDDRPLFERFRPPFIKSNFIKSIIRGNIKNLKYSIHSPYISPKKIVTCNDVGKKIYNKELKLDSYKKISYKKGYIIHFRYKSTEEFIKKYKRGYHKIFNETDNKMSINAILEEYLRINQITSEKIKFMEKEFNLNLSTYINEINEKKHNKNRFKIFYKT